MRLSTFNSAPAAVVANAYITSQGMKSSIVVFDIAAGSRGWTATFSGPARAFVLGAGASNGRAAGGYSEKVFTAVQGTFYPYVVGAAVPASAGGTSSFNGAISATGGNSATGGVGSGGDINQPGGPGPATGSGGSSSGNRFGPGLAAFGNSGAGWTTAGDGTTPGESVIDGFGIGLPPGRAGQLGVSGVANVSAGYGAGGFGSAGISQQGGMGAGGGTNASGSGATNGGPGGLGGGGSGYSVAGGGNGLGGGGLVGIERLS